MGPPTDQQPNFSGRNEHFGWVGPTASDRYTRDSPETFTPLAPRDTLRQDDSQRRAAVSMSCGGEQTAGWGHSKPIEDAAGVIGGLWAQHIVTKAKEVGSADEKMKSEQETTCTMVFDKVSYQGSSSHGFHGEIDCLNQAHDAGADLKTGTFKDLSNPCCFICAVILHSVGIKKLPAIAHSSKEYANYQIPDWLWADEEDGGVLHKVMGKDAWNAWTKHISSATRSQAESRRLVVVQMTELLHHYK